MSEPSQIAKSLGLSLASVNDHIVAVKEELLFRYEEAALWFKVVNLSRLENLYEIAYPYAKGGVKYTEEDKEGNPVEKELPPDRMWVKACIDIVKAEIALLEEQKGVGGTVNNNYNVEKVEQTIIAGSNLYQQAQAEMEESWMAGAFMDMTADDLIRMNNGEVQIGLVDERVSDLEGVVQGLLLEGENKEELDS